MGRSGPWDLAEADLQLSPHPCCAPSWGPPTPPYRAHGPLRPTFLELGHPPTCGPRPAHSGLPNLHQSLKQEAPSLPLPFASHPEIPVLYISPVAESPCYPACLKSKSIAALSYTATDGPEGSVRPCPASATPTHRLPHLVLSLSLLPTSLTWTPRAPPHRTSGLPRNSAPGPLLPCPICSRPISGLTCPPAFQCWRSGRLTLQDAQFFSSSCFCL